MYEALSALTATCWSVSRCCTSDSGMACAFGSPIGSCGATGDCDGACTPATGSTAWGWALGTPSLPAATAVLVTVVLDPQPASAALAAAVSRSATIRIGSLGRCSTALRIGSAG